jgi:hypothetical protein
VQVFGEVAAATVQSTVIVLLLFRALTVTSAPVSIPDKSKVGVLSLVIESEVEPELDAVESVGALGTGGAVMST